MCGFVLRHYIAHFPQWRRGLYATVSLNEIVKRRAGAAATNRRPIDIITHVVTGASDRLR